MIKIENMFQIPYLQLKVDNWDVKKEILNDMMDAEGENLEYYITVMSSYDYASSQKNKKIQSLLETEINILKENFGFNYCEVVHSWFQEEKKYMFHGAHNHGIGTVSSVCYLEFDSEVHTPTVFISPFVDPLTGIYSEFSPEDVESGTMIFFPSSILHYTHQNKSNISRKILSLNIDVK